MSIRDRSNPEKGTFSASEALPRPLVGTPGPSVGIPGPSVGPSGRSVGIPASSGNLPGPSGNASGPSGNLPAPSGNTPGSSGNPAGTPGGTAGTDQIAIDIAFRVIADHIRTLSFAIADGIQPGNTDRNYVLRRILRRAVRYGRTLDFHEPFFYKLVDVLAQTMGEVFPEIRTRKEIGRAHV